MSLIRLISVGLVSLGLTLCLVLAVGPASHSVLELSVSRSSTSPGSSANGSIQNITVGSQPTGILYDSANHRVYVANYASESVSVIDARTGSVVKTIATHHNAWELTLDTSNGQLFVTNGDVGAMSIINTSTERLVRTLPVGCHHAVGAVLDPQSGYVYVECDLSSEIAVVSPLHDSVLGYIRVSGGTSNSGIAVDPTNQRLFVGNFNSDTITVISTASNLTVGRITVGAGIDGTFYDAASNTVYATLHYSDQVVLVNASTLAVLGTVNVGGEPHGMVLDAAAQAVLVANTNSNNVTEIGASSNALVGSLAAGDGAWQLCYDPSNQLVFVSDHWSSSVLSIPATDF
jgi:YVTN family beta-propeller protein